MNARAVKTVIATMRAVRLGTVTVGIHGMTGSGASLALSFGNDEACGLSAGFHGSTQEMRAFAAAILSHADATDAAQMAAAEKAA